MLDAWLSEKANLYTKDSSFRCRDGCVCPGCRGDLLVNVSLVEVSVLSNHLDRPSLEVIEHYCHVAPFVQHDFRTARVHIVFHKPCPFLAVTGRCSIYTVRPAACALFPESLSLRTGRDESFNGGDPNHYPCIDPFADVSGQRKDALTALTRMHRNEVYSGEIYLFGQAGFTVDLREDVSRICDESTEKVVPFSAQAEALHRFLIKHGWWSRLCEKIVRLDTRDGIDAVLSGMKIVEALNL